MGKNENTTGDKNSYDIEKFLGDKSTYDSKIDLLESRVKDYKKTLDERIDALNNRVKIVERKHILIDNRLFQVILAIIIFFLGYFFGNK